MIERCKICGYDKYEAAHQDSSLSDAHQFEPMKTPLQKAKELKEGYDQAVENGFIQPYFKIQAKANLEKLGRGCGKKYGKFQFYCAIFEGEGVLCPDCQAAKKFYEEILGCQ